MRRAFTLIELILVIVILGIIATIGFRIVFSVYDNYIETRNIATLEERTQNASEQIAKLLSRRLNGSLGVVETNNIRTKKEKAIYSILDTDSSLKSENKNMGLIWAVSDYDEYRKLSKYKNISNARFNYVYKKEGDKYYINGNLNSTSKILIPNGTLIVNLLPDSKDYTKRLQEFYSNVGKYEIDFEDINKTKTFSFKDSSLSDSKFSNFELLNKSKDPLGQYCIISRAIDEKLSYKLANSEELDKNDQKVKKSYPYGWGDLKIYICDYGDKTHEFNFEKQCKNKKSKKIDGYVLLENVSTFRFRSNGVNGMIFKLCMVDTTRLTNDGLPYEVCKTKVVQ